MKFSGDPRSPEGVLATNLESWPDHPHHGRSRHHSVFLHAELAVAQRSHVAAKRSAEVVLREFDQFVPARVIRSSPAVMAIATRVINVKSNAPMDQMPIPTSTSFALGVYT